MSPDLRYEIGATLVELETDPDTQVLVLTGAGEAFSAGQDLQTLFRELDDKQAERNRAGEAADDKPIIVLDRPSQPEGSPP